MNNIIWVGAADRALIPKMPEEYEKFVYNGSTQMMLIHAAYAHFMP